MLHSATSRLVCLRLAPASVIVTSTSTRIPTRLRALVSSPHISRRKHHSDFPSRTQTHCSSCSSPLPTPLPICPKCKHIEPISPDMGYHEMLGFDYEPNPFDIDTGALRHRFRKAITVAHPDRWAGSNEVCISISVGAAHVGFLSWVGQRATHSVTFNNTEQCEPNAW